MIDVSAMSRAARIGKLRRPGAESVMPPPAQAASAAVRQRFSAPPSRKNGASALEALMKSHDRMNARHLR